MDNYKSTMVVVIVRMQTLSPKELVKSKDNVLILDIRDPQTFNDWHIPGSENIDVYQDIWQGNVEAVKQKLSQLPKEKKIVTVCNAGVTSQKASTILESLGYETTVLEKGMLGWNTLHQAVNILTEGDVFMTQVIRPGKGCLSYVIGSSSTKEIFIVDPSHFVEEYVALIKDKGYTLKGVIETHVHADHISGAKQLADATNTKYYVSAEDCKATDFVDLQNLEKIKIGDTELKILQTPGHTDGSVCFLMKDKALLTGDTLFLEGVGRPDLGRTKEEVEKGARHLYASLNKIKSLNADISILPAHFSTFTNVPVSQKLKTLLETNKALQLNTEQAFVDFITNNLPPSPPNYEQIKDLNRMATQIPNEACEKLEFGPNRCASG